MKSSRPSRAFALTVVLSLFGSLTGLSPVSADTDYAYASGLYNKKLYGLAAQSLREFLQEKPNDPNAKIAAYQLGAAIYRTAGDKDEVDYAAAAKAYETALVRFPDAKLAAPARFELGDAYFQLKQYEKSLAAYSAFLKSEGISPAQAAEANYWSAESLAALKRVALARAAYQKVLTSYPTSEIAPYAQYGLGILAADANDNAGAGAAFQAALTKYPQSEIAAESRLRLADALLAQKKWNEARAAYNATLADTRAKEWELDARVGLADASFGAKNWVVAATEYGRILTSLKPDDMRRNALQLRLGDSFFNAKQWQSAIDAYAPVVQNGDAVSKPLALYYSGSALRSAGKTTSALPLFRRVVDEYPKHALASKAALRMGDVLAESNDAVGAATAYKTVLTRFAGTDVAREAQEALVDLAGSAGNTPNANLEAVLRSLPAGPASSNAQLRLAQAAAEKGNWTRTATLANAVLAAKPNAATAENASYLLATAKLNNNDPAGAATVFRAQLTKFPKGTLASQAGLGLTWALLDAKQWKPAQAAARAALGSNSSVLKADVRLPLQIALGEALWRGGSATQALPVLAVVEKSGMPEFAAQAALNSALALEALKDNGAAAKWGSFASLSTDASEKARGYLRQGLALVKAKNATGALAAFDRAVTAEPQGKLAARALYESAWAARDTKNATENARWQKLTTDYADSSYAADASFQQAEALFRAKKWTDAATAYRAVATKYASSESAPLAWYQLGASLFNASDWTGAATAFDKAATLKSESAVESLFWSGESWQRAGQAAQAQSSYAKFVAAPTASPKLLPAARLGLGKGFAAAKEWPRAIATYEAGLKGASGNTAAELEFRLGEALTAAGRTKDATPHFLKVAIAYSESQWASQAQWNAAQALENAGDKTGATELYRGLAARTPTDTFSTQAVDKLKILGTN
ncbi:MAG TPA: tetratricopeptide repeat protein [Abditibacteriaceae bacterium]